MSRSHPPTHLISYPPSMPRTAIADGATEAIRSLRRGLGALLSAIAFSLSPFQSGHADVTLKGYSQLSAFDRPNRNQEALYLKRDRLRRDFTERGRSYTYIYDLKHRELTYIDHLFRQAEIRLLDAAEQKGGPKAKDFKLEFSPTGHKHELPPWECVEYQVRASLPGSMGQEKVVLQLEGQAWLAPSSREQRHIALFVKSLPAMDLFIASPSQAGSATTQVQGVKELLRHILPKGMLCALDLQVDYVGNGPMANLARRMRTRLSLIYEEIDEGALTDELFDIPAGYRVNRR